MTVSALPNNQNEVQREISERLTKEVNELFRKHGNHSRLASDEMAAILYRNLFNLLLGAYCGEYGLGATLKLLKSIVEAEQKFAIRRERSPIVLPFDL